MADKPPRLRDISLIGLAVWVGFFLVGWACLVALVHFARLLIAG